ncbi:MAG: RNB domain-containing ribonuclease, partial [Synechococcales bacterium]|nr:RNB domain-containing ribonuclease [Synechococcales bacterium]
MLIEFRLQGDRRLAVADHPEGKKNWVVIDQNGQSHTIHPRQVTFSVAQPSYAPADIPKFLKDVEVYQDPSSLEVAWELLVEDGEAVTPSDLAELLFSERRPALEYAAYYLLSEDKVYFKQKGDKYEPRSPGQVAEIRHQLEMEMQRAQERQEFLARAQAALAGKSLEWQSSDRPRLESLERLAAQGDSASHQAPAMEVLEMLGRPQTARAAFDLLVDLGVWSRHENIFLRQRQVPTQFPAKVLTMAQCRIDAPIVDPDAQHRLDLTHLKVCTIDDESTREIDDGLSLESLADGRQRLWIHIADPTRWIESGDDLDLEARRRSTSLYLPTGMIPMFPPELATGPMSLVQGKVCCALSCGVVLEPSGAIA